MSDNNGPGDASGQESAGQAERPTPAPALRLQVGRAVGDAYGPLDSDRSSAIVCGHDSLLFYRDCIPFATESERMRAAEFAN